MMTVYLTLLLQVRIDVSICCFVSALVLSFLSHVFFKPKVLRFLEKTCSRKAMFKYYRTPKSRLTEPYQLV